MPSVALPLSTLRFQRTGGEPFIRRRIASCRANNTFRSCRRRKRAPTQLPGLPQGSQRQPGSSISSTGARTQALCNERVSSTSRMSLKSLVTLQMNEQPPVDEVVSLGLLLARTDGLLRDEAPSEVESLA